jgi:hypothetical protein
MKSHHTLILFVLAAFATSAFGAKKNLKLRNVDYLKMLGHNHLPSKVLVMADYENKRYVESLTHAIAEMNRSLQLTNEESVRVVTVGVGQPYLNLNNANVPYWNQHHVPADPWLQDFGEIMAVKTIGSNKEELMILDTNRGRGLRDFPNYLSETWSAYYYKTVDPGFHGKAGIGGNYGGNIEVTPNDVLYIGNTSSQTLRDVFFDHGYDDKNVVLSTDWLMVGHVDEYLSTIVLPNATSDQCGFAIVQTDPTLGKRMMKTSSKSDLAFPSQHKNEKTIKTFRALWQYYKDGGKKKQYLNIQRRRLEGLDKVNDEIAKLINEQVRILKKKVAQVSPKCRNVKVIKFPGMFTCKGTKAFNRLEGSRACSAMLPGSANMLVLRNHLMIPDPFFKPYTKAMTRDLKANGQVPHYFDDMYYHSYLGEIHCGSNVQRYPNRFYNTAAAL